MSANHLWRKISHVFVVASRKFSKIGRNGKSGIKLVLAAVVALEVAACGGGGGGGSSNSGGSGGSSSLPAPISIVVSGTVTAPNAVIAFAPQTNLFEKLSDALFPAAYASLAGMAAVPDGTKVELVKINASGGIVTVVAFTTTAGGSYSFDLTKLAVDFSSDLVVQVTSSSSGVTMRAFIGIGGTVNLDPVSETAVRIILGKIASSSGLLLSNFTTQELTDITATINLLITTQSLASGLDIGSTVTAFKNAVLADVGVTAFVTAASGVGQASQGSGDIGNYFPFDQGNTWVYQGTYQQNGGALQSYTNMVQVIGTKIVTGATTTVFHETNPDPVNNGLPTDDYRVKDSQGISNYGNNDATDIVSPQVGLFREYMFPLGLNTSFEPINKSGLSWYDWDSDGKPETASLNATVKVAAFETVTVPVGTFANAAKIVVTVTATVVLSGDGATVTATITTSEWYAPGVGLIKSTRVDQLTAYNVTDTVTVSEDLAKFLSPPIFSSISAGGASTCGIAVGGTAYCWGNNMNGELGNGTRNNSATPFPVSGGHIFISLSTGNNHTCGVTNGGAIYCWGNGTGGQFGNGNAIVSLTPVPASGGLTFSSVSSGDWHTCGITTNGAVYCWGENYDGRLGNNTTTNSTVPVPVSGGLSFVSISAGSFHTCGTTNRGATYCWGNNSYGEIGSGVSEPAVVTPTLVSGGLNFINVSSGTFHTCGMITGGAVYCWGMPGFSYAWFDSKVPLVVSGSLTFQSLDSGSNHICGVTTDGSAYCWGLNNFGQLGNNSTISPVVTPVAVSGGLTFVSLSAAGDHSCGIASDGKGYCWGYNSSGQLGDGTSAQRTAPVVVFPSLQ
jgi:alpha-tubulin suppressor-like RCC1 family protein